MKQFLQKCIKNPNLNFYKINNFNSKLFIDSLNYLFKTYDLSELYKKFNLINLIENLNFNELIDSFPCHELNELKLNYDIEMTKIETSGHCSLCVRNRLLDKYKNLAKTVLLKLKNPLNNSNSWILSLKTYTLLRLIQILDLPVAIFNSTMFIKKFKYNYYSEVQDLKLYIKLKLLLAYIHAPDLLLNDTEENYEKINNFSYFDFMKTSETLNVKKPIKEIKKQRKPSFKVK